MILYKYFPPNTNSFKSLINAGLWCDRYLSMNDPFESLAIIERVYSKEQINHFRSLAKKSEIVEYIELSKLDDNIISDYMNSIRNHFLENDYHFASLSESYDNILLWSHYCQSHTGFVLAIEIDENDSHVQKVRYKNNLQDFDVEWFFSINEAQLEKEEESKNSKFVNYLLSDFAIKSEHWSYENEWRICRMDKGYVRYMPDDVKAIYFGINCDPEIEKIILFLSAAFNDDIPIYKMELINDPIGMIAKDYNL